MWKLLNANLNQVAKTDKNSITFGSHPSCDVKVDSCPYLLERQVFLTKFFSFSVFGSETKTHFLNTRFFIGKEKFQLNSGSLIEEFLNHRLSETELEETFSGSIYKDLLKIVQIVEGPKIYQNQLQDEELMQAISLHLDNIFWTTHDASLEAHRQKAVNNIWAVWAQMCRFGVITHLIDDPNISEVMVNNPKQIFAEINGKIQQTLFRFADEKELSTLIERIAARGGRRIDQSIPYCDTRLADGSRVHAIIPPLSLNGPCLTIRKFPAHSITPEKLIELGSVPANILYKLKEVVNGRSNILISGGTGSGKTTLLNILSSFIDESERIITIEDSAELKLQQPHVVRLESRIANVEGKGEVTLRELVRNALRMRPDRIVVGECRGAEALDMLQAMNTGHDGSMTTTHANSPDDALRRIETLVMFASSQLSSRVIREQIASSVQYIIQQTRFFDGKRRISAVYKVVGFEESSTRIATECLVSYCTKNQSWSGSWMD